MDWGAKRAREALKTGPRHARGRAMASLLEAPAVAVALPAQPAEADAIDAAFARAALERNARATPGSNQSVLRFTTLSNDAPRRGFVVEREGSMGRGPSNDISVASDATLAEATHGVFVRDDQGVLLLEPRNGVVGIRCSTNEATDWPLRTGCEFSCGASVFAVTACEAALTIYGREGPLRGHSLEIRDALTLGRAASCDCPIDDRELSRQHAKIQRRNGVYYLVDLKSTNGTYMRSIGPYAGAHKLRLGDRVLLGRTGLELCRFDWGVCSLKGSRKTMEDRTRIVHDLCCTNLPKDLQPVFFAAVYDGHGGAECAQFLQEELHGFVGRALDAHGADDEASVTAALKDACLTCDAAFLATKPGTRVGSTACMLLIFGQKLMSCANVGDSRCCLATSSECVPLSEDQTPAREDEAARIRNAGGFVIHKRVMGELAVSRAFGDAELKKPVHELVRPAEPAPDEVGPRLVLAEPEVRHTRVAGDFVLIACDGVFDVFSSPEAVDAVKKALAEGQGDPVRAASVLCTSAVDDRGSRDNATAVVVALRSKAG